MSLMSPPQTRHTVASPKLFCRGSEPSSRYYGAVVSNPAPNAMLCRTPPSVRFYGALVLLSVALLPAAVFAQEVSFTRDIRPLLSQRCFACHGPDGDTREAGLRFDIPDGKEGAIGIAIEPGSVAKSAMWKRITSDDPSEMMPPPDSHLEPLNAAERELVKRWIEGGAAYDDFWAFQPAKKPRIPTVKQAGWSKNPIDLFVLEQLESHGRKPAPEADPRTLIRRLTFDLIGLPPTRAEIAAFLKAYSQNPEKAWEQAVDDLLARPQYGEHVARYWLDLVRFADTNGMHKDFYRNHVAYRDWVIRALNENLGYDDFLTYQLAGDLYPEATNDQLVASDFNRLHLIIDVGTALPEESFFKNVIDQTTSVGTAFMGLTVQCAQCHDHKFDPITQRDFYSLSAFFNNIDAAPETGRDEKEGLQPPFISLATPDEQSQLKKLRQSIADLDQQIKAASDKKAKDALSRERASLQSEHSKLEQAIPKSMVMKERAEVRPTFIANRGQYDDPGEPVERNTPTFLPPLKKSGKVASRMDLARWLVDPQHPLTARVAVNRYWQQFFGVGLVKTSEDLGSQGEVPSHPKLLDYLAVSFVESGWDMKALRKQIVMSKTYRQSSIAPPKEFRADPENRLLARGSRYRLDAEMIRDQILATSGSLSLRMYGPSVKPPQPAGLWKAVTMTGERYRADSGEAARRRSVYTFWKRAMPPPQMTILNAPIRDACIARRERTNTPAQALLLLNEPEYVLAARRLAQEVLKQPEAQRIAFAWETVTGRLPDDQERSVIQSLLTELNEKYLADPKLADALCEDVKLATPAAKSELAAWTIVGNTLYNLDITKTKD
jgi:hypothetical protein